MTSTKNLRRHRMFLTPYQEHSAIAVITIIGLTTRGVGNRVKPKR